MSTLNTSSTVGQWVVERPRTARVFESLQIDYCCGGGKPLVEACAERQLDPRHVLDQLEAAPAGRREPEQRWDTASLSSLCDHIEQTHHKYLNSELPRLTELIAKVVRAHGRRHPEMVSVQRAFADLQNELVPHMFKEERILFPAIRILEASQSLPAFPFGSLANPIRAMEQEHDLAGDALARIRQLTRNYQVPEDACNTFRTVLSSLEELEHDMHRHVHKENQILFPRAIERERSLAP